MMSSLIRFQFVFELNYKLFNIICKLKLLKVFEGHTPALFGVSMAHTTFETITTDHVVMVKIPDGIVTQLHNHHNNSPFNAPISLFKRASAAMFVIKYNSNDQLKELIHKLLFLHSSYSPWRGIVWPNFEIVPRNDGVEK